jgi:ABC-2 type transport system ATP-binding protein
MIEFERVSRSFGERVAVDALSLHINAGELFALLGRNGAGKTTTIKMLVGLLRPGTGTIRVGGYDLSTHAREAVAVVGYIPDQPYLYNKLSGREILQFVAQMYGLDPRQARRQIDREIERFELAEFVDELTESYSHGMKQRTVFASALLHAPRVLVIDEPMVGLDPHSIRLAKNLLRDEVNAGMCVLMSTHTLTAAEEIADRVGIMHHGRLTYDGTIEHLRNQLSAEGQSLESMYLTMTEENGRPQSAAESQLDKPQGI